MSILGHVVDDNKEPLERAKIFISGTTKLLTESDSNGKFYIKNLCNRKNPESTVTIDIELRGYYPSKSREIQPMSVLNKKNLLLSREKGKQIQLFPASPPVIKSGPHSAFRLKGQVVKLCCEIAENKNRGNSGQIRGNEEIEVNWYKNSVRLNSKRFGNYDQQNPSLILKNLDPQKHNGNYECTASNLGGTTRSAVATLKIFNSENDLCQRTDKIKTYCNRPINVGQCELPNIDGIPEGMCLSKDDHQDLKKETCDNRASLASFRREMVRGRKQPFCCKPREQTNEVFECQNDGSFYEIRVPVIKTCTCQPCD